MFMCLNDTSVIYEKARFPRSGPERCAGSHKVDIVSKPQCHFQHIKHFNGLLRLKNTRIVCQASMEQGINR